MDERIEKALELLDSAKRYTRNGGEYWLGRDLQTILGYAKWENFENVVDKAQAACRASGVDVDDHFLDVRKVIKAGKGASLERADYYLTRYAAYLIAMNGEPNKPEIAAAQTYFAIQTRRQELQDTAFLLQKRFELRGRLTEAFKALNSRAKQAGVENYALFHDAGYRGLYEMGLASIKKRKGIGDREDLFDRAGRVELAANEFRVTQAEQKITRENIKGQDDAMKAHRDVGAEVRTTMRKLGGMMPEDLPAEASLKQLEREKRKGLPNPDASSSNETPPHV